MTELLPIPRHVAVIMDGNGRWAAQRGLSRTEGHRAGAEAVRRVVTRARELGVEVLTLYAFSAQNWKRPPTEVRELMGLLIDFCHKERTLLMDKDIRFRVIGERGRLPAAARGAAEVLERATRGNASMQLVIALSYGAREELVSAAQGIAREVRAGRLSPDEITEESINRHLWTADLPDPDLIIRTSGEQRLSNFLLWQSAYSELYVDEGLWPEMDAASFDKAIDDYRRRRRRFGGIEPSR